MKKELQKSAITTDQRKFKWNLISGFGNSTYKHVEHDKLVTSISINKSSNLMHPLKLVSAILVSL